MPVFRGKASQHCHRKNYVNKRPFKWQVHCDVRTGNTFTMRLSLTTPYWPSCQSMVKCHAWTTAFWSNEKIFMDRGYGCKHDLFALVSRVLPKFMGELSLLDNLEPAIASAKLSQAPRRWRTNRRTTKKMLIGVGLGWILSVEQSLRLRNRIVTRLQNSKLLEVRPLEIQMWKIFLTKIR